MLTQSQKNQVIAIIIFLFYFLLSGAILFKNNFNFSNFILLGDKFAAREFVSKKIIILENSYGYDGQFYYRLALDPFTREISDFGITLDQPTLRHQRILYPFASWLISFGNKDIVPIAMFAINVLSLLGLIILTIKLVNVHGQPMWLAVLVPLYPAFLISITRDLTEILSTFLLISGYFLFIKNKKYLATTLLSFAVLARETTLIFPVIIALFSLFLFIKNKNKDDLINTFLFLIPLGFYFIWQVVLYLTWGQGSLIISSNLNIVFPFSGFGYVYYFKTLATKIRIFEVFYLFEVIFLAALNFKYNTNWLLKITWLAYVVLFTTYSKLIWSEDWTFFRACTELYIFSFLLILSGKSLYIKKIFFFSTLAMTALMALKILS